MEVVTTTSKNSEAVKRYNHRLRDALLFAYGNECLCCSETENLEFAHKQPDDFCGRGRGSLHRHLYIKNHPEKFVLMCKGCHSEYDRTGIPPIPN